MQGAGKAAGMRPAGQALDELCLGRPPPLVIGCTPPRLGRVGIHLQPTCPGVTHLPWPSKTVTRLRLRSTTYSMPPEVVSA